MKFSLRGAGAHQNTQYRYQVWFGCGHRSGFGEATRPWACARVTAWAAATAAGVV